jgi:hypothetical protein
MNHQDSAGLALAEAARAHGDPDTVALLVAAQTEAARLEAMDADPRTITNRRALLKVAAYREAEYQLCQLRGALRHRLWEGDLIATARERPAGPRIDVPAAAWRHLSPALEDSSARDGMGQLALYDVRIVLAGPAAPTTMRVPDAAPALRAEAQPAPVYSLAVLRSWYRLRCAGWPATQPPPSEPEDRSAASRHFGRTIPRSALRAIRRELAPAHWLKPGPRKPPP